MTSDQLQYFLQVPQQTVVAGLSCQYCDHISHCVVVVIAVVVVVVSVVVVVITGLSCQYCGHNSHCVVVVTAVVVVAVMWCLEALPRLEAASRQNFHCLGLGLGLNP